MMNRAARFMDDDAQARLLMLFRQGAGLHRPTGTVLFRRGSEPDGAYLIHSGTVELLVMDLPEREASPRKARAGDVLGLDAIFSERRCEFTAVVSDPSRLDFVERERLLQALRLDPPLFLAALQLLSRDIVAWYDAVRESRGTTARTRVR